MAAGVRAVAMLAVLAATVPAMAAGPAPAATPAAPDIKIEPLVLREGRHPVHAVQALSNLQDLIAKGEGHLLSSQPELVLAIARELRQFRENIWTTARNRQSAVKYVLSGGDPAILNELSKRNLFPDDEKPLAQAASAFASGRLREAAAVLLPLDHTALPSSLAGHVALIKAMLLAPTDGVRAMQLCDQARLLSPGTLVEETALRFAIELAIATGNEGRLLNGLATWLRRFPKTPFGSTVDSKVARHLAAMDLITAQRRAWWSSFVALLPAERKGPLLAAIAEGSLRAGKPRQAADAARLAAAALDPRSPARAPMAAIEGAALVALRSRADAQARLDEVSRATVAPEVAELAAVAAAVDRFIESPPSGPPTAIADQGQPRATKAAIEIASARKRLAEIETLINGAGRK